MSWMHRGWMHGGAVGSDRKLGPSDQAFLAARLVSEIKSGNFEIAQRQREKKPLLLLFLLQPSCYSRSLIWKHVLPVRFRPQNWLTATFPCCFFLGSLFESSLSHPALCQTWLVFKQSVKSEASQGELFFASSGIHQPIQVHAAWSP